MQFDQKTLVRIGTAIVVVIVGVLFRYFGGAPTSDQAPPPSTAAEQTPPAVAEQPSTAAERPPGAEVNVNGRRYGAAPLDANDIDPSKTARVTLRMKGFAQVCAQAMERARLFDEERAARTEAIDRHPEQGAEQRTRDGEHHEEQREITGTNVELERREPPDRDDRDPVPGFADRLPEEQRREARDRSTRIAAR